MSPSFIVIVINTVLKILFFSVMTYGCLKYALTDKEISAISIFGALCAYLFMGMFFAACYQFIFLLNNNSFSGITFSLEHLPDQLNYFSFVTLTTLGYGDISPISYIAKTLSWIEAYLGQAYLTILMAFLVGRYINQSQGKSS